MRWLNHLIARPGAARHFPPKTLDAIQHAIAASEHRHLGEICFAVEGGLPLAEVVAGRQPRDRAHAAFARLRVWDTEHNTGVLVYVLIADHAIEISSRSDRFGGARHRIDHCGSTRGWFRCFRPRHATWFET